MGHGRSQEQFNQKHETLFTNMILHLCYFCIHTYASYSLVNYCQLQVVAFLTVQYQRICVLKL